MILPQLPQHMTALRQLQLTQIPNQLKHRGVLVVGILKILFLLNQILAFTEVVPYLHTLLKNLHWLC